MNTSISYSDDRHDDLLEAQAARMDVALEFFGLSPSESTDSRDRTLHALNLLVDRVHANRDDAELWLLYSALSGAFPFDRDLENSIRFRDEVGRDEFFDSVISTSSISAISGGSTVLPMRIVSDRIFVDVNSCARFDRQTGIQRVERETLPLWQRDHGDEILFVAWGDREGAYRSLREKELRRVIGWGTHKELEDDPSVDGLEFLVPWNTTIVLPEVSNHDEAGRLRAIARHTGSVLTLIGYDMIPMMSPEMLPSEMGTDFLEYLSVVKHSRAVAGISQSATEEFLGYFEAVSGENVGPTTVVACELPTAVPEKELLVAEEASDEVVILCVGSHEPRKNHGTVLHAAELLWREGHKFQLWFYGGGGWGTDFDVLAKKLKRRGRKVEVRKSVSDSVLWSAYRRASFTVFPSLHEGFGLPVAESLAFGTPAITTNYGSTLEIAQRGGSLLVDPRSDSEVLDAMRRLLTDPAELARLSAEARSIPLRSWDAYAADLWKVLVDEAV